MRRSAARMVDGVSSGLMKTLDTVTGATKVVEKQGGHLRWSVWHPPLRVSGPLVFLVHPEGGSCREPMSG